MTQPPEVPNPTPGADVPPPAWGSPAPAGWAQPQQPWGQGPVLPGTPMPPAGYALPPKPGVVPLRPLGLGDIFDGSFRILRRNPASTIGQAVLLQLLVGVITLLVMGPARNLVLDPTLLVVDEDLDQLADTGAWFVIAMLISMLLGGFVYMLTQLLCTVPTMRALLNLRTPLPRAWALSKGRIGALLLLCLLFLALWVAGLGLLAGGTFLLFQLVSEIASIIFVLVGGFGFAIAATFVAVRLIFAPAAIVAESLGPVASLKRSWVLTRGSWWRVFGILLLCSLVVGVAVSVLSTPLSIIGGLFIGFTAPGAGDQTGPAAQVIMLLTFAVSYLGAGLGAGYLSVVASLLYSDLRIRREGLDVVLMAEADAGLTEGIPGNTPLPAQGGNAAPGYGPPFQPPMPPPWDAGPR